MSTEAIRNVLLRYREKCGDDMLPGEARALELAHAELEAIEKAARDACRLDCDVARNEWWSSEDITRWGGIAELLSSIAKQER